jgi:hypothetical protein
MIQLVVNGIFLDLYENDPPKLTYSIEDITDTKITTVYSKNFRVPATKTNTEFFKTAFEINGFDFDVTVKVDAEIYFDGNLLKRGQIRLQKIYLTNYGDAADYEIIFLGETRTLASEIGDSLVSQLDFSEFNTTLTYTNVSSSWQAYYGVGTTNLDSGLFSGSILFPLVDFGNTYSGSTYAEEQGRITIYSSTGFTQTGYGLELTRFKPMIRAKVIWDKIFSGSNYTYDSDFIESRLFKHLYLSAWGNEAEIGTEESGSANTFIAIGDSPRYNYVFNYPETGTSQRLFFNESVDPGNNYNTAPGSYEYVAPSAGAYVFRIRIKHTVKFREDVVSALDFLINNYDSNFNVNLKKNSSSVITNIASYNYQEDTQDGFGNNIYTKNFGDRSISATVTFTVNASLLAGDEIYPEIAWVIANNGDVSYVEVDMNESRFEGIDAPGQFSIVPYIKNDYKQIDFIKDLSTKFRLIIAPDKSNPNLLRVEPWQEYIGTGDIFDWTGKIDLSKDIVIEPLFNSQKKKITFVDKEDGDYWNKVNQDQYGEVFGTLKIDAANDLLTDERKITTTLSPTIVKQPRDFQTGSGVQMIIPQVYLTEAVDNKVLYKPMVPNNRLLFYNGLIDCSSGPANWRVKNEAGSELTLNIYPKVSPYNTSVISDATIDLNWQRESGYFVDTTNGGASGDTGNSVYDVYWSDYIAGLYDKWSRRITAYFVLDAADLQNFSFDDVIFLKGTYYYVEKIYDVPLDRKESVKVDLIKLPNFRVPNTDFTPPTPPTEFNLWGEWPVIWNTTTDTWED